MPSGALLVLGFLLLGITLVRTQIVPLWVGVIWLLSALVLIAFNATLCDTIADQLQVLLPDEIEALLLYLTKDRATFGDAYNALLQKLTPGRLYGQLLSLSNVTDNSGHEQFSDDEVEHIAAGDTATIPAEKLNQLFHLDSPGVLLPQFIRRLRAFKAERGL